MRPVSRVAGFVFCVALAACGSSGGAVGPDADPNAPDADPNAPDANPNAPDADPNDAGFTQLITGTWTRPAGSEGYRCNRVTITEDIYITAFRTLDPIGSHHAVVSTSDTPTGADGEYDCDAGALEASMLYASGVGTDDLAFPPGVAVRVKAGQQLHLNLHTFNASEGPISGTSGVLVKTVPASEVQQEAEVVFGGTSALYIPADNQMRTFNSSCDFTADATVMTLWPHMHQIGRHMKVVHRTGAGETTLLDEPFDFNEQTNYPIAATLVKAGESLDTTCTYLNDTGAVVTFGDSSKSEMCFVGIYRYPATGAGLFSCATGPGL